MVEEVRHLDRTFSATFRTESRCFRTSPETRPECTEDFDRPLSVLRP